MSSNIYTKGGDKGQTSLLGGQRVHKDSLRVETYGTLDEGTSMLGLARATSPYDDIVHVIIDLQGEMIPLMSLVASGADGAGGVLPITADNVARLEKLIDHYDKEWIQTGQFVRPGGSQSSAALDCARAIFRRAERRLVSLDREEGLDPHLVQYLNRLSDLLYVLARIEEQRAITDVIRGVLGSELSNANGQSACACPGQGRNQKSLKAAACDRMIAAGVRSAESIGVPMVLAVVDASGDVIQTRRMDGALKVSIELAPHKAYTAAAVQLPTHELAEASQPGTSLFGIDVNMPRLTLVGGGYPLFQDGELVGAVGASGGSVAQDKQVAEAMAAAL